MGYLNVYPLKCFSVRPDMTSGWVGWLWGYSFCVAMLILYTGSSRKVWKRYSVGIVVTYKRRDLLSSVRTSTSSLQSPIRSP